MLFATLMYNFGKSLPQCWVDLCRQNLPNDFCHLFFPLKTSDSWNQAFRNCKLELYMSRRTCKMTTTVVKSTCKMKATAVKMIVLGGRGKHTNTPRVVGRRHTLEELHRSNFFWVYAIWPESISFKNWCSFRRGFF